MKNYLLQKPRKGESVLSFLIRKIKSDKSLSRWGKMRALVTVLVLSPWHATKWEKYQQWRANR